MPTRAVEEVHLSQVRYRVACAQARIADQVAIIARVRARGVSTRRSEATLTNMRDTLRVMQAIKELIEELLAQDDRATIARAALTAAAVASR